VVDNAAYRSDTAFQEARRSVSSDAADTKLFDLTEMTEEQAAAGLRDGILAGYILLEDGAQVFVRESGLRQTILKSFVDSYLQTSSAYYTVLAEDPSKLASITAPGELVFPSEQSPNDKAADSSLINFFALISMAVLFGGFLGKKEVDDIQANLSDLGARVNLAPVPKLQVFAYSMSAALLVQALSLLLLMGFLALALGVECGGGARAGGRAARRVIPPGPVRGAAVGDLLRWFDRHVFQGGQGNGGPDHRQPAALLGRRPPGPQSEIHHRAQCSHPRLFKSRQPHHRRVLFPVLLYVHDEILHQYRPARGLCRSVFYRGGLCNREAEICKSLKLTFR
jgi:hypothetical protein